MQRGLQVIVASLLWLAAITPARADDPVARVVLFTSVRCAHCQVVKRDVLPPIEARFGERLVVRELEIGEPAHYEALMAIEEAHGVPPAQRVVPTAVIGDRLLAGGDAIARELPAAIEAALARDGSAWPPQVVAALGEPPPTLEDQGRDHAPAPADVPARAPIWITYVYQTGCQECARARSDLAWIRARHPDVRVEELNVFEHAAIVSWLADRAGRRLAVPAMFIGEDALVGPDEVEARALDRLVERYADRPAPRLSERVPRADATAEIVARFRRLGPAAVIAAGLVDGVNPCAFATLIFFVSYLGVSGRKGRQVLVAGASFTLGVFLAYLSIGLGLYRLLDLLGGALGVVGRAVMIGTALVCAVFAVLSFRDFVKARRGALGEMSLTLPGALRDRIHAVIRRGKRARFTALVAFGTGLVVSLLELACTGQVYLPTIVFVTTVPELRASAIGYLLLYNVLFILPLIVVFVLVYFGTTSTDLTRWLKTHAKEAKLGMTVFFAALAVWLLVAATPSLG